MLHTPIYTAQMTSQARNHCFTLNNPREDDRERILAWKCKYVVFGEEKGEEKGTPHFQGYVEWSSPKRLETLKQMDTRISWHIRAGTATQAADYCKKGEQTKAEYTLLKTAGPNYGKNAVVHEHGTISAQGKRTDIMDVGQQVVAGVPLTEIASKYPCTWIRYCKGIKDLKATLMQHRTERPEVHWRYGVAGVGKTHVPAMLYPDYYDKDGTQWWDGYEQQSCIIIDDFDGKWPFRDLLRLLDRYKYQGQYKGGYVKINSPVIFICCEFSPYHIWPAENDLAQIKRRLASITHVISKGNEVVEYERPAEPLASATEASPTATEVPMSPEAGFNPPTALERRMAVLIPSV
ncbi:MAG: putative viral replication protein [Cressdnaviricota sp.]|nr:MAG: putative viral replication protein [Cressdnaviricota sp.]